MGSTRTARVMAEVAAPEGVVDAAGLAAINRFALVPLSAAEVYVRGVRLANDAYDRTYERFPREYLERFAETLPGKALLLSHQTGSVPLGLWFDAGVRASRAGEPGEWSLEAWFYLPVTPENQPIRAAIDAGVLRYCSIGYRYDQLRCDGCGLSYFECPHYRGQPLPGGGRATFSYGGELAKVEAREGSLVYLGAQYGAEVIKEESVEGSDLLKRIEQGEARLSALEATLCRGKGGADGAEPDTGSRELIADGRAYREYLQGELLRLGELVGARSEAGALVAALGDAPAAKFLPLVDGYRERLDALMPPAPHAALLPEETPAAKPHRSLLF